MTTLFEQNIFNYNFELANIDQEKNLGFFFNKLKFKITKFFKFIFNNLKYFVVFFLLQVLIVFVVLIYILFLKKND